MLLLNLKIDFVTYRDMINVSCMGYITRNFSVLASVLLLEVKNFKIVKYGDKGSFCDFLKNYYLV